MTWFVSALARLAMCFYFKVHFSVDGIGTFYNAPLRTFLVSGDYFQYLLLTVVWNCKFLNKTYFNILYMKKFLVHRKKDLRQELLNKRITEAKQNLDRVSLMKTLLYYIILYDEKLRTVGLLNLSDL